MEYILLLLVMSVAFFNGANDVSKGVATLHGSGLTGYRGALLWGTVWTAAGGLAAFFIASGLLKVFTSGIVSEQANPTAAFSVAIAAGVTIWLVLATRAGMPVSTTHAIVGAVCGAALVALGPSGILWGSLGSKIILPLIVSPLAALAVITVIYKGGTALLGALSGYCLCLEFKEKVCCTPASNGRLAATVTWVEPGVEVGATEKCVENGVSPLRLNFNDMVHWASSAMISFARGLNDTPKIVAVLAAAAVFFKGDMKVFFLPATAAMALGGYFRGLRVTETLSEKITDMDRNDSVIANLTTAGLVVFASRLGMPVSTTHVSSSSIVGIGLKRENGAFNRKVVFEMLISWAVTLPVAGAVSAAVYLMLSAFA